MKNTFLNIPKEKQQLIITKAMIEFKNYGYESASTNRIVNTAGISKGSLFKYFETKLDMYSFLIDYTVDILNCHMRSLTFISTGSKDRLLEYCEHQFDFLALHPDVGGFLHRLQKDLNHPDLVELKKHVVDKSYGINKTIFEAIGIGSESILSQHLIILITGFNNIFFNSVDMSTDVYSLKDSYMKSLEEHLNLVVWS